MTEADRAAWDRLNAYVDGELPPDERSAMEERSARDPLLGLQIAGLRQLKREVRTASRSRRSSRSLVAATAAVLLLGTGLAGYLLGAGAGHDRISLTQLADLVDASATRSAGQNGFAAAVPDLEAAGFRLVSAVAGINGSDGFALVYQGPLGCRVGLAVLGSGGSPTQGGGGRVWTVGGRSYVLLAPRMDPGRFARLAAAVEDLTRGIDGSATRVALGESSTGRACLAS